MKARDLIEKLMMVDTYLRQCKVQNLLVEDEGVHFPPSPEESKELINFLRQQGLNPAIVGSVGVLRHLKTGQGFRPTVDLDIWVSRAPKTILPGWRQDPEAVGVISWISPSGGYVDFLLPNQQVGGEAKTPRTLNIDKASQDTDYPVADILSLLYLKLNSNRPKDMSDTMELVKALGKVPKSEELGKLNRTQTSNLDLADKWFASLQAA
jgi:hypothetical protein